jgi:hypothetical protein
MDSNYTVAKCEFIGIERLKSYEPTLLIFGREMSIYLTNFSEIDRI